MNRQETFPMRAQIAAGLMAGLCALSGLSQAHGPTRQKATETITINAPPAVVWEKVRDFGKLQDWHPAIESSTVTQGNEVGSLRTLTLKGGGQIVESLESWSDSDRRFSYRMKDPGPVPVTNYSSTLTVKPGATADSALVEWRGAFYRGYPNNDPPPDKNDDAAIAAVTGIYQAGLGNLKALLEKR
jgi:Polyketide cyclase / dehydrase and lipid transport